MAKAPGYSLTIPIDLYEDLRNLAASQNMTVEALLSNAIQWQYILADIKKREGEIFIRFPDENQPVKIEMRSKKYE